MTHSTHTEQISSPSGDSPDDAEPVSFSFVAACLIVPIIWGVVVHRVFRHLRRRSGDSPARSAVNETESVWPDYQI